LGQGDSNLFKGSPKGHVWPHPRGLNFYIVIYREMLKKKFFSRTAAPNGTIFSLDYP